MTNHEAPKPRRKLDAAGWVVLLFLLAAIGGLLGSIIYLVIMYAKSIGG